MILSILHKELLLYVLIIEGSSYYSKKQKFPAGNIKEWKYKIGRGRL
jgi:hypothetical protein